MLAPEKQSYAPGKSRGQEQREEFAEFLHVVPSFHSLDIAFYDTRKAREANFFPLS